MTDGTLLAPVPLADRHDVEAFASGAPTLDAWIRRKARANQASGASRTYVLCRGERVVGFYALAAGSVSHDLSPRKLRQNMPDPVPVIVLGRLAVDASEQGNGLGRALLRDGVLRGRGLGTIARGPDGADPADQGHQCPDRRLTDTTLLARHQRRPRSGRCGYRGPAGQPGARRSEARGEAFPRGRPRAAASDAHLRTQSAHPRRGPVFLFCQWGLAAPGPPASASIRGDPKGGGQPGAAAGAGVRASS